MTLMVERAGVRFREYASEADWWAVRGLLLRTQASTPVGWNWDIRHWDGARFHRDEREGSPTIQNGMGLWEDNNRLVAAVHCEAGGDAFLELDPDYRWLQQEMLDWAEVHLARATAGHRRLEVYAHDYDLTRRALFGQRGYTILDAGGWVRLIRFGSALVSPEPLPRPYVLATTSDASAQQDAERMAVLLNAAFGRTLHTAAEYLHFMGSPSFSHELSLVSLAPDGSFAAHVGVTFDEVNRFGIFEPVCTHPLHTRKGLARALVLEGMRRLQERGACSASVETGEAEPANALYRACGFTEEYRGHWFARLLDP